MEQHTSHPSKQPPSSRRLRTAAVLVCVLALALFALWRFTRPEPAEGVKTVTVEVTHSDGAEAEFTYQTDLVYLGELLEQEGLISGSDGAYGLFVDTVDGETADYAGRIVYDDKGSEVFGFGKYKGRRVEDIFEQDPSYYTWMMNGDFPLYTKKVITEIRLRKKNGR